MMDDRSENRRRALGRGLEALLPTRSAPREPAVAEGSGGQALNVPVDAIDRNPFQTRSAFDPAKLTELARSIEASGVVQPIVVRKQAGGRYQLVMGERRLLASRQAGKQTIPAIVQDVTDEQAMMMTIVENLQRADLNPMEQARAYQRLSNDFHLTQEQMATRTGKERASVANFLRLLKLPHSVQQQVEAGELSFGHARALLALEAPEKILSASQKVASLSLSVRQTETYVQGILNPADKERAEKRGQVKEPLDPNVLEAQQKLQRTLGLHVRIEDKHGKGRVIIEYANLEDFDILINILDAHAQD